MGASAGRRERGGRRLKAPHLARQHVGGPPREPAPSYESKRSVCPSKFPARRVLRIHKCLAQRNWGGSAGEPPLIPTGPHGAGMCVPVTATTLDGSAYSGNQRSCMACARELRSEMGPHIPNAAAPRARAGRVGHMPWQRCPPAATRSSRVLSAETLADRGSIVPQTASSGALGLFGPRDQVLRHPAPAPCVVNVGAFVTPLGDGLETP